ncbi:hypothetical protein M8J76_010437 [Diaphorina citri]|nr:hypothetical protein M8J75_008432 [Diaphorina citri]KAI5741104.1 hypothetical protein M8J76_010437 [Diaphorina citri]
MTARKTTVQTNPPNETERNSEIKPYLNATESNSARLPQVSLAELKVIQETLGDLERQGDLDLDLCDSWRNLAENQEANDGGDLSSHHVTLDLANRIVQSYTGIQADLKYGVSGILSEIMDLVQDVVTSSEAGEDGLELPDFYKDTDSVSRSLDLMGAPTSKQTDEHQTDPSSWSLEGQPRFFQTRRRFSKWKGKSSKRRSRVQPSTAETDSASDLSSETDRFLRALLNRPNGASSGNQTERSNGVSVEDDERVIPSVFHLDEDMRRQIENIDVLLGQDPKETRVDELKCSDSDSDVELLDMATRKFLKKIQNKRLQRKRGLGFYLRKLKLLDTQIQNIIEGKDTSTNVLSEEDWNYLLSKPGDELSGDKEEDDKEGGNGKEDESLGEILPDLSDNGTLPEPSENGSVLEESNDF